MDTFQSILETLKTKLQAIDPQSDIDPLLLRAFFEDTVLAKAEEQGVNLDIVGEKDDRLSIQEHIQKSVTNYSAFLQACIQDFIAEYQRSMNYQEEDKI